MDICELRLRLSAREMRYRTTRRSVVTPISGSRSTQSFMNTVERLDTTSKIALLRRMATTIEAAVRTGEIPSARASEPLRMARAAIGETRKAFYGAAHGTDVLERRSFPTTPSRRA